MRTVRIVPLLLVASIALADSSIPSAAVQVPATVLARARALWLALPSTTDRCRDFDYWPQGGMRSVYCHLLSVTSWRELQELAGVPVFLSGPHSASALSLRSRTSFGHYNPAFVRWLGRAILPAVDDEAFRRRAQPIYDADLRQLARIFYVTHEKLLANPDYLARQERLLTSQLQHGGTPAAAYEKYGFFMNPEFMSHPDDDDYLSQHGFDGGWDVNVTKTAVAFWIRRSVDGTDAIFFDELRALVQAYDGAFLRDRRDGVPAAD